VCHGAFRQTAKSWSVLSEETSLRREIKRPPNEMLEGAASVEHPPHDREALALLCGRRREASSQRVTPEASWAPMIPSSMQHVSSQRVEQEKRKGDRTTGAPRSRSNRTSTSSWQCPLRRELGRPSHFVRQYRARELSVKTAMMSPLGANVARTDRESKTRCSLSAR